MAADISQVQGAGPVVGGPVAGGPSGEPAGQMVPFRSATQEQAENIGSTGTGIAMTAAEQTIEVVLPQTGYLYGVELDVNCVTAANAAATAFFEDGPWSALSSCILRDTNAPLVDMPGFSLRLLNLYGGWQITDNNISADTNIKVTTTGAGGTGGSFRVQFFVPVSMNRRTLVPLLGNQDRGLAYILRDNIASGGASASGPVYTTAPTTLGTITMTRTMERYAVPAPVNDSRGQNAIFPDGWGIVPFNMRYISSEIPAGGSQVPHFVHRLGNIHRIFILVLRSNGTRASAESNLPTNLQYRIGNTLRFNEAINYRRELMFQRYGSAGAPFDAPSGVIVYDELHDFAFRSGYELGNDWVDESSCPLAA